MPSNIISLIGLPISTFLPTVTQKTIKSFIKEQTTNYLLNQKGITYCLTTVDNTSGLWMTSICHKLHIPYIIVLPAYSIEDDISNLKMPKSITPLSSHKFRKQNYYINKAIQFIETTIPSESTTNQLRSDYIPSDKQCCWLGLPFIIRNKWMIDNSDTCMYMACYPSYSILHLFLMDYLNSPKRLLKKDKFQIIEHSIEKFISMSENFTSSSWSSKNRR